MYNSDPAGPSVIKVICFLTPYTVFFHLMQKKLCPFYGMTTEGFEPSPPKR